MPREPRCASGRMDARKGDEAVPGSGTVRRPDAADAGPRRNPKGRGVFGCMPVSRRLGASGLRSRSCFGGVGSDPLCAVAHAPWPTAKSAPSRPRVILLEALNLLVAVSALVLLVGCQAAQKPQAGKILGPVVARPEPPNAGTADDFDWLPPPPPPLVIPAPPRYKIDRIPERPAVIGRLDVPLTRKWEYIVIHHSYTESGSEKEFDNYHRTHNGWLGVGYDFVIGNGQGSPDGAIEVTFRWETQIQGAHAGNEEYNQHGIGICLVGNFETGYPTEKQMAALVSLVSCLQERCHIPSANIILHRHVRDTRCPGEHFPFYRLISLLPH